MLLLTLTRIFVLLVPICCYVSKLKRCRRQNDFADENAVIEVFNNCKCVYYYQCDANNIIITNGESIINVRRDTPKIPCRGAFENEKLCCKLNNSISSLQPQIKSSYEVYEAVDENNTSIETKSSTESNTPTERTLPIKMKCGAQKTILSVRIFTDEDELTPISGEFPWIAAIFKRKASSEDYTFHCSGSLIHPQVVLTANHCVHKKQPRTFRVIVNGEIKLSRTGKDSSQERNISEIVHHPNYYSGGLYNDAALLILSEPYEATKQNFINTLCLPPTDIKLDNTRCLVAGWGKDQQGESQQVMKKVELPFVEFNQCQNLLRKTRLGPEFNLHKSFMCAGGEKGRDACKGDGGSPLMCPFPSENRYFQIGIVSWGIGCGEENVPGVYGNLNEFSEWIKSELTSRGLTI